MYLNDNNLYLSWSSQGGCQLQYEYWSDQGVPEGQPMAHSDIQT